MESYYWLILMAICIVIEIFSLGLTTIWFALGSLVSFIIAVCGGNVAVQVIAFLVVSIISLIFTRPLATRFFNKDRVKTNAESLVGEQAKVIERIDNVNATGRVTVNGQEWMARTVDGSVADVGKIVIIDSISGVKLIVK